MYRTEKKDTFLHPGLRIPEILFKFSKAYFASLGMFNVLPGFLGRLHFLSGFKNVTRETTNVYVPYKSPGLSGTDSLVTAHG